MDEAIESHWKYLLQIVKYVIEMKNYVLLLLSKHNKKNHMQLLTNKHNKKNCVQLQLNRKNHVQSSKSENKNHVLSQLMEHGKKKS
jgi:hypothetical protein